MKINHVKPVAWVDTEEAGVIQPSHVAELSHFVELEPEDIALLTGPAGPQGVQGVKGDRGDVGPAGADGAPGVAGAPGLAGPQGMKGDKGDAGADGVAGPQGVPGGKGDRGDVGPSGVDGARGAKGDTGAQGIPGPVGSRFGASPNELSCDTVGYGGWGGLPNAGHGEGRLYISNHTGLVFSAHDFYGGSQVFSQSFPTMEGAIRIVSMKSSGVAIRAGVGGNDDLREGDITFASADDMHVTIRKKGSDGVVRSVTLVLA